MSDINELSILNVLLENEALEFPKGFEEKLNFAIKTNGQLKKLGKPIKALEDDGLIERFDNPIKFRIINIEKAIKERERLISERKTKELNYFEHQIIIHKNSGQINQNLSREQAEVEFKPLYIKNKPDKINIILTIIGLILTALGVWFALQAISLVIKMVHKNLNLFRQLFF